MGRQNGSATLRWSKGCARGSLFIQGPGVALQWTLLAAQRVDAECLTVSETRALMVFEPAQVEGLHFRDMIAAPTRVRFRL